MSARHDTTATLPGWTRGHVVGQLRRLDSLTPATGARHDDVHIAMIDG